MKTLAFLFVSVLFCLNSYCQTLKVDGGEFVLVGKCFDCPSDIYDKKYSRLIVTSNLPIDKLDVRGHIIVSQKNDDFGRKIIDFLPNTGQKLTFYAAQCRPLDVYIADVVRGESEYQMHIVYDDHNPQPKVPYAIFDGFTLTFYYGNSKPDGAYDVEKFEKDTSGNYIKQWHSVASEIYDVIFDESFKDYRPTNCSHWFEDFINLNEIIGMNEYLNTELVTDMSWMFGNCKSLLEINVGSFHTNNVTNMSHMFEGCANEKDVFPYSWIGLVFLDLSNFNTSHVTDMSYMFADCSNLERLNMSGFNTSNVTDMSHMFEGCKKIENLDVSMFNTGKVTNMSYMFSRCGIVFFNYISFEYNSIGPTFLDLSNFNTSNVTDMSHMFEGSRLEKINLSSFNTSNVTNMSAMFGWCEQIISLDLSMFNTENVTDMSYMFQCCYRLKNINVSKFNTKKVTDMSHMFGWCEAITNLDVRNFNTSNVTNMSMMFGGDDAEFDGGGVSVSSLDLSSFNTEKVQDMSGMFACCKKLVTLNLSGFNTENVTSMSGMFYKCSNLTNINLNGFKTKNVTYMGGMFRECSNLSSLDVSGFNTENVTDMYAMFYGCSNLTYLDLSGFKTDSVQDIGGMFYGCNNIKVIYVGDLWNMGNVISDILGESEPLFGNCKKLVGGQGTRWSPENENKSYARIDGGILHPGYLTKKNN